MIGRVAALVALAATAAAAEPVDLGPATLTLDDDWTGPAADAGGVVRTRGAATAVVVRYEVPNLPAWRDATRTAHVDAIVRGFASAPGYVELARALVRTGPARVPTLELTFRRRGAAGVELVAARVLLFRTLTLVAIVGGPGERAGLERAARALTPD
ncbi:MAG: hypothetical protein IPL61_16690 [Myxococcales bacterium]|nr:hypothetical protein [Myxococcales bacterium]